MHDDGDVVCPVPAVNLKASAALLKCSNVCLCARFTSYLAAQEVCVVRARDVVLIQWSIELLLTTNRAENRVCGRCEERLETREVHGQGQRNVTTLDRCGRRSRLGGTCKALKCVGPVLEVCVDIDTLFLLEKGEEGNLVQFDFGALCQGLVN